MQKIRKGDKVKVICGDDKGKVGEVLKVLPVSNKVIVQGINLKKTFSKRSSASGVQKEHPINISNVAMLDSNGSISKIGFKVIDSKKSRFFKTTGQSV